MDLDNTWGDLVLTITKYNTPEPNAILVENEVLTTPYKTVTGEPRTLTEEVVNHLISTPVIEKTEIIKIGTTVYTRDIDYSLNYLSGQIKRIPTGSLPDPANITADYKALNKAAAVRKMYGGRKPKRWTIEGFCDPATYAILLNDYYCTYERKLTLENGKSMIATIDVISSATTEIGTDLIDYTIVFAEA